MWLISGFNIFQYLKKTLTRKSHPPEWYRCWSVCEHVRRCFYKCLTSASKLSFSWSLGYKISLLITNTKLQLHPRVLAYLLTIVASYFTVLEHDTKDGPKEYDVTGGVPLGSVLDPPLWNIMYNGLLRLKLPRIDKLDAHAGWHTG